jgi:predicted HTH domain antitoxin
LEANPPDGGSQIFGSTLGDNESEGKMNVAIELPEDIARQLSSSWGDTPRRALEAVALEGYRSGALSRSQVGLLIGLNFWETEAFLKEKQAYLPYAESDLAHDRAKLDSALGA